MKKLFLIDGIGALLTAFFLIVIFGGNREYFQIPRHTLNLLSIIALVFSLYSFCCFLFLKNENQPFLWGISIANLLYCVLTMILVINLYPQLNVLTVVYFVAEVIIICSLAFLEISYLRKGKRN